MSPPFSCIMNMWEKMAGDNGRSTARWEHSGHEALEYLLILVVIASEGRQQAFKTYFYSQSQFWVLQADEVTCMKEIGKEKYIFKLMTSPFAGLQNNFP